MNASPAALVTALRVGLGGLWIHEGFVKLHAGFGKADILLVANGAKTNSRIPAYFAWFAEHLLAPTAGLAGLVVPFIELGLGLALVLGILAVPVAFASALNLMTYWASDQLIWQYPLMGALSAVLLLFPSAARQASVVPWLRKRFG